MAGLQLHYLNRIINVHWGEPEPEFPPIALWKFVEGAYVITETETVVLGGWTFVVRSDSGSVGTSEEAIAYRAAYAALIEDGYHDYGEVWENEGTGLVAPPFVSGASDQFIDFGAAETAAGSSQIEGPGADPRSFFEKYNKVYQLAAYNDFKVVVETFYLLSTEFATD